jgi:hypothetical protein
MVVMSLQFFGGIKHDVGAFVLASASADTDEKATAEGRHRSVQELSGILIGKGIKCVFLGKYGR